MFVKSTPRTVAEQFEHAHRAFANAPALLASGRWLSFDEVRLAAERAVELLAEHGARPGDRIILFLENSAVLRIFEHAVLSHGLVRVAISSRLHPREVASIAADCTAAVVCCEPARQETMREALAEHGSTAVVLPMSDAGIGLTPEVLASRVPTNSAHDWPRPLETDVAMLMYSSGTTGRPKGACVTHRSWLAQTELALAQLPTLGPGDILLAVAPMAHFGGSIGLDCMASGVATIPMAAFDAVGALETIVEFGVTVLPLAPVMLTMLVEDGPPSLLAVAARTIRAIPYGGSPTNTRTLVAASDIFRSCLVQYYGLSETLAPVSCLGAADHDRSAATVIVGGPGSAEARYVLESAGRPVAGVELRLRQDDALDLGTAKHVGEIAVRSPMVTSGYWNRPELTAAALRGGWFATGDLGELDANGYLHLLDRTNDVIISGGFNVYPGEVERVIASVAAVKECVVVGVPHARWGEGVHALVVLRDEASDERALPRLSQEIHEACRRELASYKKPVSVEIASAIPRTAAGKADRKLLRARFWG